jgi:myosin heavy subunit
MIEFRAAGGILPMLDEECNLPKGSEEGLLEKMGQKHGQSKFYKKVTKVPLQFCVKHFAGEVTYSIVGFMDKNKDGLLTDLEDSLKQSSSALVRELYDTEALLGSQQGGSGPSTPPPELKRGGSLHSIPTAGAGRPGGRGGGITPGRGAFATMGKGGVDRSEPSKKASGKSTFTLILFARPLTFYLLLYFTVGTQFKTQLGDLTRMLSTTDPHYIRCIKPCFDIKSNNFVPNYVLTQMRCAGVLETGM